MSSIPGNNSLQLIQYIKREFANFQKYIGEKLAKIQEKNEEILHQSLLSIETTLIKKVESVLKENGEANKRDLFGFQAYLESKMEEIIKNNVKENVEQTVVGTNNQLFANLDQKFQSISELINKFSKDLEGATESFQKKLDETSDNINKYFEEHQTKVTTKIDESLISQQNISEILQNRLDYNEKNITANITDQVERINKKNAEFHEEFNVRHKEISDQLDIVLNHLQEIKEHNSINNIDTFTEKVVLHLPPPDILYEHIHSAREIMKENIKPTFVKTYVSIIKNKFLESGASTPTVSSIITAMENTLEKEPESEMLKQSIKEELVEYLNRLEVISRTEKK